MKANIEKMQTCFRKGRDTRKAAGLIRMLGGYKKTGREMCLCFTDMEKTTETVTWEN